MKARFRWYLLCEDREQERFFKRLGRTFLKSEPVDILIAPSGEGAAWGWVLKRYPKYIKQLRRHPGENLALIVVVDGDNEGYKTRKHRFDDELNTLGLTPRINDERVAICVPTWSIETWVAWLCRWHPPSGVVDEGRSLKTEVAHAIAKQSVDVSRSVAAWSEPSPEDSARVPSLEDGRQEMKRVRS